MTIIQNKQKQFDTDKGIKGKSKMVHLPIMIEKEDYQLAYVCEDVGNDKNDSFLILLTKIMGERRHPKLIKFTKTSDGKYWKVPEDRVCNTSMIKGLTWDFLK